VLLFCLGTFFYFSAMYVYVPILSVYAASIGSSLAVTGLVVSAYGLTQLITRIPMGFIADKTGRRKPFVLLGTLAAMSGCLGLAWSTGPWGLVASRAVIGLGGATWLAFTVLFASHFPASRVTYAMSLITFVSGAAQAAAGLVGGFLAQTRGPTSTFYAGAILAALGFAAMLLVREKVEPAPSPMSFRRLVAIGRIPSLRLASILAIVSVFVPFVTTLGFTPIYASQLGVTHAGLGVLFTVAVVAATLANLASAVVAARLGNRSVVVIGMAMAGIATAFVPLTASLGALLLTQVLASVGRGICDPILLSVSMRSVPPHERGSGTGVFQAIYAIGMFGGPAVGGFAADRFGLPSVFLLTASLCALAVVVAVVAKGTLDDAGAKAAPA
jgi:MFS family permease